MAAEDRQVQPILNVPRQEMGQADTLRYNVNVFILGEQFELAVREIEGYMAKDFDLPGFKEKIKPYLNHAIDLVNAIRAKQGFSKHISLTRSKQQELQETLRTHYDELQYAFKKIEQIRYQLQLDDLRSTVWIIKSATFSVFVIVGFIFINELIDGAASNFALVIDDYLTQGTQALAEFLGW